MVDSLLACAEYFEVDEPKAALGDIWAATSDWPDVARSYGLSRTAIDQKATAFEPLRSAVQGIATATNL